MLRLGDVCTHWAILIIVIIIIMVSYLTYALFSKDIVFVNILVARYIDGGDGFILEEFFFSLI